MQLDSTEQTAMVQFIITPTHLAIDKLSAAYLDVQRLRGQIQPGNTLTESQNGLIGDIESILKQLGELLVSIHRQHDPNRP